MTIRHMKIFVEVYRLQNITKAAKLLHMTQPAVTRAIQEIEKYYGIVLFERINRCLSATECGKQLYSHALHITDSFDIMEKSMKNWDNLGVIRVGASITLGNFLLPELISQFQKEHPDIKIQAAISNSSNLQKKLINNQLDIALIEGFVEETELKTEIFNKDRLVLIVPPGHVLLSQEKVELNELRNYPFILREHGSVGRTLIDNIFAAREITLNTIMESSSTQAIVKAVSIGIGISILPEQLVYKDIINGLICTREIIDESFERNHYLVWHKNKYLTKAMLDFLSYCRTISKL